jgi:hypothetical protein
VKDTSTLFEDCIIHSVDPDRKSVFETELGKMWIGRRAFEVGRYIWTRDDVFTVKVILFVADIEALSEAVDHHRSSVRCRKRGDKPTVKTTCIKSSDRAARISAQGVSDDPFR